MRHRWILLAAILGLLLLPTYTFATAPVGFFDDVVNETCRVTGWSYDQDSPSESIPIHIYRDNPAGSGILVRGYHTNVSRVDVNNRFGILGNHGFDITFYPTNPNEDALFDGFSHLLYIYGIDAQRLSNTLLTNSPKTISCPDPAPSSEQTTGISGTTSANYADISKAFDHNSSTYWTSGKSAPQWIQIDLGTSNTINQIRLLPMQTPDGITHHVIKAGLTSEVNTQTQIAEIYQYTKNNTWINVGLPKPIPHVRYITISTVGSPSNIAWSEIEIYSGTTAMPRHLKYFGYYNTSGWQLPNGFINFTPEIEAMHNSNMGYISVGWDQNADDTQVPLMLSSFKQAHLKSIFYVSQLFFSLNTNRLWPDWENRWARFKKEIQGYESDLFAFYFDEPYSGIPKADFQIASVKIRQDFPDKTLLVVEAGTWVDKLNTDYYKDYYKYATDMGIDYYYSAAGTSWETYINYFNTLVTQFPDKKIWLVPDGLSKIGSPDNHAIWNQVIINYYNLGKNTDQVVGMLIFTWPDLDYRYSIRNALLPNGSIYDPNLRALHIRIGQEITNPPSSPVAGDFPGDANGDGRVDGVDYSVWISHYNQSVTGAATGDFNNSGKVDGVDYVVWVNNYGV